MTCPHSCNMPGYFSSLVCFVLFLKGLLLTFPIMQSVHLASKT